MLSPQRQKRCPSVGVFRPIPGKQYRFCLQKPVVPADNPTSDQEDFSGSDVVMEANPKLGG